MTKEEKLEQFKKLNCLSTPITTTCGVSIVCAYAHKDDLVMIVSFDDNDYRKYVFCGKSIDKFIGTVHNSNSYEFFKFCNVNGRSLPALEYWDWVEKEEFSEKIFRLYTLFIYTTYGIDTQEFIVDDKPLTAAMMLKAEEKKLKLDKASFIDAVVNCFHQKTCGCGIWIARETTLAYPFYTSARTELSPCVVFVQDSLFNEAFSILENEGFDLVNGDVIPYGGTKAIAATYIRIPV